MSPATSAGGTAYQIVKQSQELEVCLPSGKQTVKDTWSEKSRRRNHPVWNEAQKWDPEHPANALRTMWTLTMNRLVLPKAIRYLMAFDLSTKKVKSANINCTGQTAKKASELWICFYWPAHHGKWTCIYVESLWSTDHSKHFYNSSHSQPPGQALLGRKLLVSPFQCRKQIQSATQILPTIADKMGPGGQRYPSGIFALSRLPQQQQQKNSPPPTRGTR